MFEWLWDKKKKTKIEETKPVDKPQKRLECKSWWEQAPEYDSAPEFENECECECDDHDCFDDEDCDECDCHDDE